MNRRPFAALVAAGITALGAAVVEQPTRPALARQAIAGQPCNGSARLCGLRLDQVTFAGAHNAMASTADGFEDPSQMLTITDQLELGIRALLIDVYPGFGIDDGRAVTDLRDLPAWRRDLVEPTGRAVAAGAVRRGSPISPGTLPTLFTCHGWCELGAAPFASALRDVDAFLDRHPREVLLLLLEDHADPALIAGAFAETGLVRRAYAYDGGLLPTLSDLIRSDRRLVVTLENGVTPEPWLTPADDVFAQTPTAGTPDELTCGGRVDDDPPMLIVNQWVSTATPDAAVAAALNRPGPTAARARACGRARGRHPTVIAADFVQAGDIVQAAAEINAG